MQDLRITASLQDNLSGGLNTITESLGKTKKSAEQAQKSLKNMQGSINSVQSSLAGLIGAFQSGNFIAFGQQAINAATAFGGLTSAMGAATGAAGGLGAAMTAALGPVGLIVGAIGAVGAVAISAGKAAADLDTHLDSLQSLTGLDDSSMKQMSDSAVKMSKDFKASAADIVDSMKLIGSQAPELLKDQKGLQDVTKAANVLAEAGQIEVVDAAKAITTTMNQMNVQASEASNIINTLAAASQQGSADISYLNTAFEKAGTQAKSAGMSYSDLAAAIETVGPKFSSADVAGSKLQALLLALSVQANDNFKPAVVGMSQALDNLAKAELTDAQMKEMVGASQITMLQALIEGKETYKDYTKSLTGTNTAYEQMAQNNDNLEGSITKLKSAWEAAMITLGNSTFIQGAMELIQALIEGITDIINQISGFISKIGELTGSSAIIEAMINPFFMLTQAVKILGEAISIVVALATKILEGFQEFIQLFVNGVKARMQDWGIWEPFVKGVKWMYDKVIGIFNAIKQAYNDLKKWLGMEVKEINKTGGNVDITKPTTTPTTTNTDVKSPLGKTGKTTKVKVKVEAEPGSLDALKKQLSDLQKSLTSKNLSVVDIEKTKKQIADLQKEIDKKEMELGIKPKKGSLEYIESEISKIDSELKKLDPQIDIVRINELKADKSALEGLKKDVESSLQEVVVTGKAFKTEGREGSLKEAQDRVSYYKAKLQTEVEGSDDYNYLISKIKEWEAKEETVRLKVNADLSDAAKGSMKWLSEKKAYWQGKLDISAYGTPEYVKAKKEIDKLTKEENKIKLQVEIDGMGDLEKVYTFMDGFHAIDGVVGSFESLSNAINENANAWKVFMGFLQLFESVMATINAVTEIANMLSGISTGVKTAETAATVSASAAEKEKAVTDAAAVAPATAQTVANKALEVSYLDLASAMIFAAHASIPFAGVGLATGFISTMLSVQAATKAATMAMMAFETGGIVGGNSYHGDRLMVRVNSGEMILNGRQQKNLFDAINENRISNENSNRLYGEVKVKGQDLYIALSNLGKVKAPLGKHIGIR